MIKRGLVFSTIFLTIINVLIRILGFVYRIFLVRFIGAEGLGLFELVSPIAMFLFTILGSGVPIAVMRLTAQGVAKNQPLKNDQIIKYISFIMFGVSILLFISLILFTPFLSISILKDERLSLPLYIFAPTLFFASLSAIFRGYFYGLKNVVPPALSQLVEQGVRMVLVFSLLFYFSPVTPIGAVSISMAGVVLGEFFGFVFLLLFYRKRKFFYSFQKNRERTSFIIVLRTFFSIALPITFSRMLSSILRVITALLIPGRLLLSGLDKSTALSVFGKVNGMAMPLLFLPFTFTSALVLNLIPRISEYQEKKNLPLLHRSIGKGIEIAFMVGIPTSCVFYLFSDEIFSILYGESSGLYLKNLSILVLFLCVYQITTSILQGLGKQFISTIFYVTGMLFQLFCTYFLVANPSYGIEGYILSMVLSFFFISTANFFYLLFYTKIKLQWKRWFLFPIFATISSSFIGRFLFLFLLEDLSLAFSTVFALSAMALSYLGILFITKEL